MTDICNKIGGINAHSQVNTNPCPLDLETNALLTKLKDQHPC